MKSKRIRWRKPALDDLREFHTWLSAMENAKSGETIARIRKAADSMARLGDIGRPSIEEGVRELSVRNAPYVIAYRVTPKEIEILAVYHTAQDR